MLSGKNEEDDKQGKKTILKQNIQDQISAGNNFVCFISNISNNQEKTSEVFLQGSSLSNLIACDESTFDLSIDNSLIKTYQSKNAILKQLYIHGQIDKKNSSEKVYSFLSQYNPVQISAYNTLQKYT